jgi:DNA invertase Pin-like site-specific DNA recombinase
MNDVACYIRLSKYGPTKARQRRTIDRWLSENDIDPSGVQTYLDKATIRDRRQPHLQELKAAISKGEVTMVVLSHLNRLSPTLRRGIDTLADWSQRPLRVVVVEQQIDLRGKKNKRINTILSAMVKMGQGLMSERTKAGLKGARARGRTGGRPSLTPDDPKVLEAKRLHKDARIDIDDICKRLKISRSTLYRYVGM